MKLAQFSYSYVRLSQVNLKFKLKKKEIISYVLFRNTPQRSPFYKGNQSHHYTSSHRFPRFDTARTNKETDEKEHI